MIGVKLNGRLGNQMFQYAFAFATAKKLKTNFFLIENKSDAEELSEFFELPGYKKSISLKLGYKYFQWMKYHQRAVKMYHNGANPINKTKEFTNNCVYEGFFQSSFYFEEYDNQIKEEFIIRKKHRVNVHEVLNIEPNQKIVAIHVRRTDYSSYGDETLGGGNLLLPVEYYKSCLQKIENLYHYKIVFVTDEPSFVHSNFAQYEPIVSSSTSPIIDFQILMSADKVIVANSSFSWWGAYLNNKASEIFAPRYWSGFKIKQEYPPDILPKFWKTIEVQ